MKIATLVDPAGSGFGFLLPIFVDSVATNQAFVQRIGLSGTVLSFDPFEPIDEMYDVPPETSSCGIGDSAIWAFKYPSSTIYCGTAHELGRLLLPLLNDRRLSEFPVLEFELAKFCGEDRDVITFAQKVFQRLTAQSKITAEVWRDENIILPALRRMLGSILSPRASSFLPAVRMVTDGARAKILLPAPVWEEFQQSRHRGRWNEPYLSRLGHAVGVLQVTYEKSSGAGEISEYGAIRPFATAQAKQPIYPVQSPMAVRLDDGSYVIRLPQPWILSTIEGPQEAWSAASLTIDMSNIPSLDTVMLMTILAKCEERARLGLSTKVIPPSVLDYEAVLLGSGFWAQLKRIIDNRAEPTHIDSKQFTWGSGPKEYISFGSHAKPEEISISAEGVAQLDWGRFEVSEINAFLQAHLSSQDMRLLRDVHSRAIAEAVQRARAQVLTAAQCLTQTRKRGALFLSYTVWDDGDPISDAKGNVERWSEVFAAVEGMSVALRSGTELIRSDRKREYIQGSSGLKQERRLDLLGNMLTFRVPRSIKAATGTSMNGGKSGGA